jgi:hypothetical protein
VFGGEVKIEKATKKLRQKNVYLIATLVNKRGEQP